MPSVASEGAWGETTEGPPGLYMGTWVFLSCPQRTGSTPSPQTLSTAVSSAGPFLSLFHKTVRPPLNHHFPTPIPCPGAAVRCVPHPVNCASGRDPSLQFHTRRPCALARPALCSPGRSQHLTGCWGVSQVGSQNLTNGRIS